METRKEYSETYGNVTFRKIGTVDVSKFSVDEFQEWNEKYHPTRFFAGYCWASFFSDKENTIFDVWLVLAEDNVDWKPVIGTNYWNNTVGRNQKPLKQLPICVPPKKIEKWIAKTNKALVP